MTTDIGSILELAVQDGAEWDEFGEACYELGSEGTVRLIERHDDRIQEATGQHVYTFEAEAVHSNGNSAYVLFHVGVRGDEIFTGYEETEYRDLYVVKLSDGRNYSSQLWQPEPDEKDQPVGLGWHAVSPIKMAIWWAICARLLEQRPLID